MDANQTKPSVSHRLHLARRLIPVKGSIDVRPRVKNSVEQALSRSRLVFACAPKGYGKTLAVSAYARSVVAKGGRAEWVELWPNESPEQFLCYLLDAVKQLLDIEHTSLSDTSITNAGDWRDVLEVFLLELNQRSVSVSEQADQDDLVLVINGWNAVSGLEEARYILETLMRFTPPELKLLIVSSCFDSELIHSPVMLNIQPQVVQYYEFSMGFSEVLQRLTQLAIDDADERASRIMQKTLGWPLAIEVMAKDISILSGIDDAREPALLSRLTSVLASQFDLPELKTSGHILAVLALVERISESFCKEVFGSEGEACFSLLREHLILQQPPEGECSNYFLFNPVLRGWLQETYLKAMPYEELEPWVVLSSEWFVQHKAFSEAINLCTFLGQPELMLSIAEKSCDFLLQQHGFHQLRKLEHLLSPEVIASSPKLRSSLAWAWAYSMDFDQATNWLDSISNEEAQASNLVPVLTLIRAWCFRYQGKVTEAETLLEDYRAAGEVNELTEAMYLILCSRLALSKGETALAEQRINESLRKARTWSDGRLEAAVLIDLCRLHQQRGDWHAALASIDKGIELLRHQTLGTQSPFYGRMMMFKAYILWIQGDWINAENVCDKGVKTALHNEDPLIVLGFCVKALLHRGKRSFRKAHRGIFELERLMHCWGVPDSFYQSLISLVKAYTKLDEGQTAIAEGLYQELLDNANWHAALLEWLPHVSYYLDVLGVRLQLHRQEWQPALTSCDELVQRLTAESRPTMHIPVMVLQATCYDALDDKRQSSKVLKRALMESMNCSYIAPFMELGGQVAPLLARLNERGELGEFIYRLQHLEGLREHLSIGNDVCVPLSDREQGVLALIAEGHSNQSVADKLFISLNTVKTHARKINTKLGVKNRTQAIAKARELGLL